MTSVLPLAANHGGCGEGHLPPLTFCCQENVFWPENGQIFVMKVTFLDLATECAAPPL
jgi:hypothetical protein